MKKYFLIAKNTWDETFAYRLNFVMWRVRMVLQLLTTYFLWYTLLPPGKTLFGYDQSSMLTYIFGTSIFFSIILANRSGDVGELINSGNLSNYLLRPMNFFLAWFFRDIGDKAMNLFFSIIEITLLYIVLRPPLTIQTDPIILLFVFFATCCAVLLNFFINLIIGSLGFWTPEVWAPRFIFWIIIYFFSGSAFPLDILPKPVFVVFEFLPFTYLLYFPLKIYLGQLSMQMIISGMVISAAWVFLLFLLLRFLWQKGMHVYTAQGR